MSCVGICFLFFPRKQVFLGKTLRKSAVTLVTSTHHHLPNHPPGKKLRKDSSQPKSGFMFKNYVWTKKISSNPLTLFWPCSVCARLPAQPHDIWIQSHQAQKRRRNGKVHCSSWGQRWRKTPKLNEQKPEKCALIAVLPLPFGDTCSWPSQTEDEVGIQHKHICICAQFIPERGQAWHIKLIQIIECVV